MSSKLALSSRPTVRITVSVLTLALGLFSVPLAQALTFTVNYDSSVNNAPLGFKPALLNAVGFYQNTFSNPININLNVGWGTVNNQALSGGALGASSSFFVNYDYATVRTALSNVGAPGYLPATDPTNGRAIDVNTANAKALGLNTGGAPSDGGIGFDSTATWTFDPTNRAVTGAYDFIGVAMHEISEVMGRSSSLVPTCTGGNACSESLLDLFRYTAPGQLDLAGTNAYLSIDGGKSQINTFNGNQVIGDLGDWSASPEDAYNYSAGTNQLLNISAGDNTELTALGYTLAAPVPVPDSFILLLSALGLTVLIARRRRTAPERVSGYCKETPVASRKRVISFHGHKEPALAN